MSPRASIEVEDNAEFHVNEPDDGQDPWSYILLAGVLALSIFLLLIFA